MIAYLLRCILILIYVLPIGNIHNLFSQDYIAEVKGKLNSWDRKMLSYGEQYKSKGLAIRTFSSGDSLSDSDPGIHLDRYYQSVLEASHYMIFAADYESQVLHRNIGLLRKKFMGNPAMRDSLISQELAAYDSLYLAESIRSKIKKKLDVATQALQTLIAEQMEQHAINTLSKVLYSYLSVSLEPGTVLPETGDTASVYPLMLAPAIDEPVIEKKSESFSKPDSLIQTHKDQSYLIIHDEDTLQNQMASVYEPAVELAVGEMSGTPAAEQKDDPEQGSYEGKMDFRVQIAACRKQLTKEFIEKIYQGNMTVDEIFEDQWYKYSLGHFSCYAEAKQLKEQISTEGAFIVFYINERRIKITPVMLHDDYLSQAKEKDILDRQESD